MSQHAESEEYNQPPWHWLQLGQTYHRKRNKKPGFNIEGGPVILQQIVDWTVGTFRIKMVMGGSRNVTVKWDELEPNADTRKRESIQRTLLDPTTGATNLPSLDSKVVYERHAEIRQRAARMREKREQRRRRD